MKANNLYSSTENLQNGIPQGSPLSVILFQIATNKLSSIISNNKYFKHVIYADDLYIIFPHKPNIYIQSEIDSIFLPIIEWCKSPGTKISYNKTKLLHLETTHRITKKNYCLEKTLFLKI